jgi:chromosome segregation ATPase
MEGVRLRAGGAKFIFHINFTRHPQAPANLKQQTGSILTDRMQTGLPAAIAAMEQAILRLDAALAQRAAAFRRLSEQHGLMAGDTKTLRDELQAARDEADGLRERAALVDALRAELAQFQEAAEAAPSADVIEDNSAAYAAELATRDTEIAVLRAEIDTLRSELTARAETTAAATTVIPVAEVTGLAQDGDMAALKAELAAARASHDEMQAFQSGMAARLEATMARLRQALDAQAQV